MLWNISIERETDPNRLKHTDKIVLDVVVKMGSTKQNIYGARQHQSLMELGALGKMAEAAVDVVAEGTAESGTY